MKYVVEIDDMPMIDQNGNQVWRAKNFKTLVFDERGLKKLEKVEDSADAKKRAEFASLRVGDVLLDDKNCDRFMIAEIRPAYSRYGKYVLYVINNNGRGRFLNEKEYTMMGLRKLHKMITINEFFYQNHEDLDL